ncbi:hypothetical protein BS50DRAFT_671717 [Corynespora cassiicola Philippines]|uniref:C3H1-type domain-containing protein n=1 Tax=Corynespora cassiicola Philippines TaxID=1448308 RepID=A0A2T2PDB9_CORCC|nr:hypothetical protein BS50DRAFT_671717 [Corynespora cassiicola Philippines]
MARVDSRSPFDITYELRPNAHSPTKMEDACAEPKSFVLQDMNLNPPSSPYTPFVPELKGLQVLGQNVFLPPSPSMGSAPLPPNQTTRSPMASRKRPFAAGPGSIPATKNPLYVKPLPFKMQLTALTLLKNLLVSRLDYFNTRSSKRIKVTHVDLFRPDRLSWDPAQLYPLDDWLFFQKFRKELDAKLHPAVRPFRRQTHEDDVQVRENIQRALARFEIHLCKVQMKEDAAKKKERELEAERKAEEERVQREKDRRKEEAAQREADEIRWAEEECLMEEEYQREQERIRQAQAVARRKFEDARRIQEEDYRLRREECALKWKEEEELRLQQEEEIRQLRAEEDRRLREEEIRRLKEEETRHFREEEATRFQELEARRILEEEEARSRQEQEAGVLQEQEARRRQEEERMLEKEHQDAICQEEAQARAKAEKQKQATIDAIRKMPKNEILSQLAQAWHAASNCFALATIDGVLENPEYMSSLHDLWIRPAYYSFQNLDGTASPRELVSSRWQIPPLEELGWRLSRVDEKLTIGGYKVEDIKKHVMYIGNALHVAFEIVRAEELEESVPCPAPALSNSGFTTQAQTPAWKTPLINPFAKREVTGNAASFPQDMDMDMDSTAWIPPAKNPFAKRDIATNAVPPSSDMDIDMDSITKPQVSAETTAITNLWFNGAQSSPYTALTAPTSPFEGTQYSPYATPSPTPSKAAVSPQIPPEAICRFFAKGTCFRGSECRFYHDENHPTAWKPRASTPRAPTSTGPGFGAVPFTPPTAPRSMLQQAYLPPLPPGPGPAFTPARPSPFSQTGLLPGGPPTFRPRGPPPPPPPPDEPAGFQTRSAIPPPPTSPFPYLGDIPPMSAIPPTNLSTWSLPLSPPASRSPSPLSLRMPLPPPSALPSWLHTPSSVLDPDPEPNAGPSSGEQTSRRRTNEGGGGGGGGSLLNPLATRRARAGDLGRAILDPGRRNTGDVQAAGRRRRPDREIYRAPGRG